VAALAMVSSGGSSWIFCMQQASFYLGKHTLWRRYVPLRYLLLDFLNLTCHITRKLTRLQKRAHPSLNKYTVRTGTGIHAVGRQSFREKNAFILHAGNLKKRSWQAPRLTSPSLRMYMVSYILIVPSRSWQD
jgi:hypothetical protein